MGYNINFIDGCGRTLCENENMIWCRWYSIFVWSFLYL